jgi:hypothetical protein
MSKEDSKGVREDGGAVSEGSYSLSVSLLIVGLLTNQPLIN